MLLDVLQICLVMDKTAYHNAPHLHILVTKLVKIVILNVFYVSDLHIKNALNAQVYFIFRIIPAHPIAQFTMMIQ